MTSIHSSGLIWSFDTAFGAFLGYMLHWLMSLSEWRKIGRNANLGLLSFLAADPPGVWIGLISTIIVYFSLPILAEQKWVSDMIGFAPGVNFFSAVVTAYCSNSIAIKLRNISRKIEGVDQTTPDSGNGPKTS